MKLLVNAFDRVTLKANFGMIHRATFALNMLTIRMTGTTVKCHKCHVNLNQSQMVPSFLPMKPISKQEPVSA